MKSHYTNLRKEEQNLVDSALMMFNPSDLLIRKTKEFPCGLEIVPAMGLAAGILMEIGFTKFEDMIEGAVETVVKPCT